jgi:hypothetical protein
MTYIANVAVCSEIPTKHSAQSEHHVEFFNVESDSTHRKRKELRHAILTRHAVDTYPGTSEGALGL